MVVLVMHSKVPSFYLFICCVLSFVSLITHTWRLPLNVSQSTGQTFSPHSTELESFAELPVEKFCMGLAGDTDEVSELERSFL